MRVVADLHIHSHYSRATSPRLTPPGLDRWARVKGIDLLGTGDCTHPEWLAELRSRLDDAEEGLYTLKKSAKAEFDSSIALADGLPNPAAESRRAPRFVLTGEISTIYSYGGKTRKVHHLVILPDFAAALKLNTTLAQTGNITSDGRPILGVDSRDLLAMLLDADERAILIPAHIWTPWFSALGAKSGFDSLDDCYRDLAPYIKALETGLSSNPPMNWAVESLDRFAIVSNSDAHSPDKLGREATVFDMEMSWPSLAAALGYRKISAGEQEAGIVETVEFFPSEGKYHYDGHRACGVVLTPEASVKAGGLCPVCGKPLTYGVMRRVLELAGRAVDEQAPCPRNFAGTNRRPYRSLIPLKEIAAEILEAGAASKKTSAAYAYLAEKAGGEFSLLMYLDYADIARLKCPGISGELLALAVRRMREGEVFLTPGYDGEYGIVRVFDPAEKIAAGKEAALFEETETAAARAEAKKRAPSRGKKSKAAAVNGDALSPRAAKNENRETLSVTRHGGLPQTPPETARRKLSPEQEKAAAHSGGHALVIAGPGTGKTALLAERIKKLTARGTNPEAILAVTFTVKAAAELRERIAKTTGEEAAGKIRAETFHSFCASVLREHAGKAGIPRDFRIAAAAPSAKSARPENESRGTDERAELLAAASREANPKGGRLSVQSAERYIEERKRFLLLPGQTIPGVSVEGARIPPPDTRGEAVYAAYRGLLKSRALLDFDDLVAGAVRLFAACPETLTACRNKFRHIFVDEYQDINFAQYALLSLFIRPEQNSPAPELYLIGDPNQAVYGFRGADTLYIDRFLIACPDTAVYHLTRSFRCAAPIIRAADGLAGTQLSGEEKPAVLSRRGYPTEKAEAEGIARRVSRLIGGTTFFSIDSGVSDGGAEDGLSPPGECAILLRAAPLSAPIEKALTDHGIPFHLIGENPWRGLNTEDSDSRAAEVYVNAVNILTLHAAKGLEFDHVFIAGLEEGILPFTLYDTAEENSLSRVDEEKRLLYVGMTRARRGLYLSWARSRLFRGRKLERNPSRFLDTIESLVPLAEEDLPKREKNIQPELF